jgi:hypothetical protein
VCNGSPCKLAYVWQRQKDIRQYFLIAYFFEVQLLIDTWCRFQTPNRMNLNLYVIYLNSFNDRKSSIEGDILFFEIRAGAKGDIRVHTFYKTSVPLYFSIFHFAFCKLSRHFCSTISYFRIAGVRQIATHEINVYCIENQPFCSTIDSFIECLKFA